MFDRITIRLEDSDFKKIVSAKQKFEAEINEKLPIEEYLTLLIENDIIEDLEGDIDISIHNPEQSNLENWHRLKIKS
jgi:hypothetical protein